MKRRTVGAMPSWFDRLTMKAFPGRRRGPSFPYLPTQAVKGIAIAFIAYPAVSVWRDFASDSIRVQL